MFTVSKIYPGIGFLVGSFIVFGISAVLSYLQSRINVRLSKKGRMKVFLMILSFVGFISGGILFSAKIEKILGGIIFVISLICIIYLIPVIINSLNKDLITDNDQED
jgi:hypothetical protein